MIKQATSIEQLRFEDKPLVACFTNPVTCNPCKQFAPHYEQTAAEFGDEVDFFEVNILEHMDIATEFGVMVTPTVLFITNEDHTAMNSRTALPLVKEIRAALDG